MIGFFAKATMSNSYRLCLQSCRMRPSLPSSLVVVSNYSTSTPLFSDDAASATKNSAEEEAKKLLQLQNRLAAIDYNRRRAEYKRQVTALRREYAKEVADQRAADEAEREAKRVETTRRRLERQRLKNIRSAQNAIREKERRERRQLDFEEHLRVEQIKREAKEELYTKARQLVIDQLEKEAHLWLTTPEEVEAAFTPEAEQLLWARKGGILGAPNPSLDTSFWQYETHTLHVDKTYKSKRQYLLEKLEEAAYEEANIDPRFWNPERVQEHVQLEEKARLRAMVHSAGRTSLLKRQKQMLEFALEGNDLPQSPPTPNLGFLKNDAALEREGAKLLMEDPTRFFVFENSIQGTTDYGAKEPAAKAEGGPSLGAPIALRDPLRDNNPERSVYPTIVGLIPKPDKRTEKQKKQEERERRMWEAAQAKAREESKATDALEDEDDLDTGVAINYDELEWDPVEEEFRPKRTTESSETDISVASTGTVQPPNAPRMVHYSKEDIDWVAQKLEEKLNFHERQYEIQVEELLSRERTRLGFNDPNREATNTLEEKLLKMSSQELSKLADLDDRFIDGITNDELHEAMKGITSLSEKEIMSILQRPKE